MSIFTPYTRTPEAVAAALAAAAYKLPHTTPHQLPGPHYLVEGDAKLPGFALTTGTVVVTGSLEVTGPVDLQQAGKPIVNLVVVGDCTLGLAYVDAFLCVGGTLRAATLIADSNWSGGVFVGGDLVAHTLVIKDVGVEVDGTQHVERVADCEDPDAAIHAVPALFVDEEPAPRALFLALRDSSPAAKPRTPARRAKPAASKRPAAKPKRARAAAPRKRAAKPAARAGRTTKRTAKKR